MQDQNNLNHVGLNAIGTDKIGPNGIAARKSGHLSIHESRTAEELTGSNAISENIESLPREKKSLLKAIAHRLPHPILVRAFLLKYVLKDLLLERKARHKNKLIPVAEADLAAKKKSDTVFLLGSGPSINAIPGYRWSAIKRHDSMGCNFWLFHKFVPTFYFHEVIPSRDRVRSTVYRNLAERRAKDYEHCVKIMTGLIDLAPEFDLFRPDAWAGDLHTVNTIPVAARNEREFVYGLRLLRSLRLFRESEKISFIFKQASSVTGLISFALRMGYKQIVLCGVDLHSGEYFYQDSTLYPDGAGVEFQPRNAPHLLMTPQPWKILTDEAVVLMKREILEPAGVKVYVENRSSRLWPAIPEAPASLFS
jgi:hypothetical protein